MSLATYSALQTSIASWLNRSDLTSQIPDFVVLAEARFNREIRRPEMLTRDETFSITDQYVSLPTGFLEALRFTILTTPVTPLDYVTPEDMSERRRSSYQTGKPRWYTVIGGSFEFLPAPEQTYTASLTYYKKLDGLATTSPNWLLTSHPDVYLFGSLVAAEAYIMNDERLPVWKAQLDEALQSLRVAGSRREIGGTPKPTIRSF